MAIYALFISFLTWVLYRKDKQQAELGGRRTPESTLHALEVFGGWPAAFLFVLIFASSVVLSDVHFFITVATSAFALATASSLDAVGATSAV